MISELEIQPTITKSFFLFSSVILINLIICPNGLHDLIRKEGILKWQFSEEVGKKYYAVMADKLDKLDRKYEDIPPTRDNQFERDFKVLGIDDLPDIKDIVKIRL